MQAVQNNNQPPVIVERLPGKRKINTRTYVVDPEMSTPEKKRYKMEDGEKMVDAGYLLTFPMKGHSIVVDQAELDRLTAKSHDPNGFVESEKVTGVDNTQVLRASGGNPLVAVYMDQAGGKK